MSNTTKKGLIIALTMGLVLTAVSVAGSGPTDTPCRWQVESGESLSKIGNELGADWRDVYAENSDRIADPNLIVVGQILDSCIGEDPSIAEEVEEIVAREGKPAPRLDGTPKYPLISELPSTMRGYHAQPELVTQVKDYVRWYADDNYGWTGDQWNCLDGLYQRESSWYPKAANPHSSARTLWQVVKSTAKHMGIPNHPEVNGVWPELPEQAEYGLLYIKKSYGTPCAALEFWLARVKINGKDFGHWY